MVASDSFMKNPQPSRLRCIAVGYKSNIRVLPAFAAKAPHTVSVLKPEEHSQSASELEPSSLTESGSTLAQVVCPALAVGPPAQKLFASHGTHALLW